MRLKSCDLLSETLERLTTQTEQKAESYDLPLFKSWIASFFTALPILLTATVYGTDKIPPIVEKLLVVNVAAAVLAAGTFFTLYTVQKRLKNTSKQLTFLARHVKTAPISEQIALVERASNQHKPLRRAYNDIKPRIKICSFCPKLRLLNPCSAHTLAG